MAHSLKLLLTENVDGTGIVGDVVTVRKGFARNFLLPRGFATTPTDAKVEELAQKRADAQKMLAELRQQREVMVGKLEGFDLSLTRSCNDLGILYGAVTQQDICDELAKAGHPGIKPREVRLAAVIKRVGGYDVHVKFETDLEATVKLNVKPDRVLDTGRRRDEEQQPSSDRGDRGDRGDKAAKPAEGAAAPADGTAPEAGEAKKAKPEGDAAKSGERGEKRERGDREERRPRGKMAEIPPPTSAETGKGKWGKLPTDPTPQEAAAESKPKRRK